MPDWIGILGAIIFVNLVLSGDNALVIGTVAATIEPDSRWLAFVVGGGGAILIRIGLTYAVTLLLQIAYVQATGGILLLFITARLLSGHGESEPGADANHTSKLFQRIGLARVLEKHQLLTAMLTILLADLTTSLDNIVAIGALAQHDPILLVIGLLLSIALLLVGSAIIAHLIGRLPWLILVAATVLVVTAAQLILQDDDLPHILPTTAAWWPFLVYGIAIACIIIPVYHWLRNYMSMHHRERQA
jgi:YjbE family integral membrane protein